jgi:two-component system CheB/CheR fusion protein
MDVGDASVARIHQLEEELSLTRDHLRTAVQDLEGSNEELQATNEELVAANEELQSTNEELQSVNEELHTVNTEHQQRILELSELSDDLSNLLRLVQIGTIFLDGRLAVRRYNGGATRVVPLQPHDVGRRITDLRWEVPYPQLADDTAAVLGGQGPIDRELVSPNGELWHVSVQPYRSDDSVAGLVITTLLAAASQETSLTLQYRRASELSGIAAVFVHPSTAEVGALERAEVVLGLARDSLTAQAVLDAALETADGASGALRAGEVELRVRTHREGTGTDTILVMLDRT